MRPDEDPVHISTPLGEAMAELLRKRGRVSSAEAIEDALKRCRVEEDIKRRAQALDLLGDHAGAYRLRVEDRPDRYNFWRVCLGVWQVDRERWYAAWNASAGSPTKLDELLVELEQSFSRPEKYSDLRERDERGRFWFRKHCGADRERIVRRDESGMPLPPMHRDPRRELCAACAKRRNEAFEFILGQKVDVREVVAKNSADREEKGTEKRNPWGKR